MRWRSVIHAEGVFGGDWQRQATSSTPEACDFHHPFQAGARLTASARSAEARSRAPGESTYGVAQFVQPRYFILPHTRVKFRIALGMSDQYGDGRSFDGYGFGVDMLLAAEEAHRPEAILKLAATLIEP